MSVRFTGRDAHWTSLWIARADTVLGADTVPLSEVALVMDDGEDVAYMQGTPSVIRRRLQNALDVLDALEV